PAMSESQKIRKSPSWQARWHEEGALGASRPHPGAKKCRSLIIGERCGLALTIMLETGDIRRFPSVGDYSSYCRCIKAERLSNGKRKGEDNCKAGNKYLSWAYSEATHFAVHYEPAAQRSYDRKCAKTKASLLSAPLRASWRGQRITCCVTKCLSMPVGCLHNDFGGPDEPGNGVG
ncbi:MAG TPA: hypothetical protein ENI99_12625, partial [Sedimenticola sp.]|nr:hypothetical protein [Sedimenticola sp.]